MDQARFVCNRRGTLEGVRSDRLRGAVAPYVVSATLPRMGTGVAGIARRAEGDVAGACIGLTSPSDDETGEDGEQDKDTAYIIFAVRRVFGSRCFDRPPIWIVLSNEATVQHLKS